MPGSPGYDDDRRHQRAVGVRRPSTSPAPRRLLEEAGVATPVQVRFHYAANNPRRASEYELIRDSAAQAGFEVLDGNSPNWSVELSNTTSTTPPCSAGSRRPRRSSTRRRTTSPAGRTTSTATPTRTVDAAYEQIQVTTDPAAQQELAAQIEAAARRRRLRGEHLPIPGGPGLQLDVRLGSGTIPLSPTMFYAFWEWQAAG